MGATITASGFAGCTGNDSPNNDSPTIEWTAIDPPTEKTLHAVVISRNGSYMGGGSGQVLAWQSGSYKTVVNNGPTGEGNTLRGAGVAADGRTVWFVGGSGVIGAYNVVDDQLTDYSAPMGKTSTWLDIAVAGPTGDEHVYLVNGSRELLPGHKTSQGNMEWRKVVKPGGGSTISSIDFIDTEAGYTCDTNAKVYETTTGGKQWQTIGIEGGSVGLYDITAVDTETINVAGSDGSIFQYNSSGWSELDVSSSLLYAIDRTKNSGLAAGESGTILQRTDQGWTREQTPTSNALRGITIATGFPDIAVGNSGTILER